MTPSTRNVFACPWSNQGRKTTPLLVAGRNGTYTVVRGSGTLCYLGELNDSAQVRWLKTIEVFNENGETQQLKLFPSEVEPPADDPDVAQVRLQKYGWNAHGSLGSAIWAGSYSAIKAGRVFWRNHRH